MFFGRVDVYQALVEHIGRPSAAGPFAETGADSEDEIGFVLQCEIGGEMTGKTENTAIEAMPSVDQPLAVKRGNEARVGHFGQLDLVR